MTFVFGLVVFIGGNAFDRPGSVVAGAILMGCYVIADSIDSYKIYKKEQDERARR